MMTATQVLRLRRLAEDAAHYHKQSGFCERPATCGGCHWWSGYLAAVDEIHRGVDPNATGPDVLHPALVKARERLLIGAANRQRLADQDRSCPADYACAICGWTGQHSLGCPNAPRAETA